MTATTRHIPLASGAWTLDPVHGASDRIGIELDIQLLAPRNGSDR